jgi:hypothetical protein|tara:strand:+ start:689 stop:799 length:111 start_codon:yes stop_codon:yes gene_type:complete
MQSVAARESRTRGGDEGGEIENKGKSEESRRKRREE